MLTQFQEHLNNKLSFLKTSKLLLAISGGVDSVVLAHLCTKLGLNIALAHCNFNLRGDESDADEDFVLQFAEDLELEVFIEGFETQDFADNEKVSIQMAARTLRYHWFNELTDQLHFDYVLTAHHADDNLETFLINLSRGTGLDGLLGIPEINGHIVRPLLNFSRVEIENYAKEQKLSWREDTSNLSTKYLRNKLRHDVIPVLKEINPQLLQNFTKTQSHLIHVKTIVDDKLSDIVPRIIKPIDDFTFSINISELNNLAHPQVYLYEILKEFGFTEWNDVYNLLEAQSGKYVQSQSHRLIKDRAYLLVAKIHKNNPVNIDIFENDSLVETPFGTLLIEEVKEYLENEQHIIYVNKKELTYPLSIRKWEKGDVFYPIGMAGKKKLSKFFKDEKYSMLDKENAWLLCSNNNIVWVIGKRADNRFKVGNNTQNILKIELK